jgi:hypothetical protein
MATSVSSATYATTATPANFWRSGGGVSEQRGGELLYQPNSLFSINTPLSDKQKEALFASRFRYVKHYFDEKALSQ